MTETPPAPGGRTRHWLADAAIGGALTLALITAAEASLPPIERSAPMPRLSFVAKPPAGAHAPTRPAPPPVLIAFQPPLRGYPVISPFGLRQLPWEEGGRLHAGVDIAAPAGLPAVAAADGVVTRVGVDPGYGRFVELKHAAGLSTRYAHLGRAAPQIAPGVAVKAGTPVGEIGSTGASTGAHLHFEVRDAKDRPLNPELFIGRRFAETKDLPLRTALRIPHQVRQAYVSVIPRAKREAMRARLEQKAAQTAADTADHAGSTLDDQLAAASASDAGVDAGAVVPRLRLAQGRPHARFIVRN